jgi:hypothetical protein
MHRGIPLLLPSLFLFRLPRIPPGNPSPKTGEVAEIAKSVQDRKQLEQNGEVRLAQERKERKANGAFHCCSKFTKLLVRVVRCHLRRKVVHKSCRPQISDCARRFSPNCHNWSRCINNKPIKPQRLYGVPSQTQWHQTLQGRHCVVCPCKSHMSCRHPPPRRQKSAGGPSGDSKMLIISPSQTEFFQPRGSKGQFQNTVRV